MTQIVNVHIGLAAWTNQSYSVGDRRSNAGNAYQCTSAGTSTSAPTGTGSSINNGGTAVWKYLSSVDATSGDLRYNVSSPIPQTLTQPVIVYIWNDGLIAPSLGVQAIWLSGHTTSATNTITVRPAPGDGFDSVYTASPTTALAFNSANGTAIQCPASGTGSVNYIQLDDNNVILHGIQIQDPNSASLSTLVGGNGANLVVENCILDGYSQGSGAVLIQLQHGLKLTNNLIIARNTTVGGPIVQVGSVTGVVIVNNTFAHTTNVTGQRVLDGASNPTAGSNLAKNNIFINYDAPFVAATTQCWSTDHNFYTAASFSGSNAGTDNGGSVYGITTSATFVAFATDFNLKTGAAPLDAAATDTTDIPAAIDIFGTSRPQGAAWDGGCMELRPSAFSSSLSDSLATSDVNITMFSKTLAETASTSDTFIPPSGNFGSPSSRSDTIASSDTLTAVLGLFASLSESASTSSTVTLTSTGTALPTETAITHDAYIAQASAFSATLTDTVATSDLAQSLASNNYSDTISSSDSYTSTSGSTAGQTNLTGVYTSYITPVSTTDVKVVSWQNVQSVFVNVISVSILPESTKTIDVSLQTDIGPINSSESAATSEVYVAAGAAAGSWADTATTGDNLAFNASVALSTSAATSESLTAVFAATPVTVTDTAATSDARSGAANPTAALTDSTATSDAVSFIGIGFSLTDTKVTSENLTGVGTGAAALSDTISSSETLQIAGTAQSWTDSAAVSDNLSTGTGYALGLSDTAATADSLTPIAVGQTGSVAESVSTSDALPSSFAVTASLSDSAAASGNPNSGGFGFPLTDAVVSSDSTNAAGIGGTTQNDTSTAGDSLTFLRGYIATLADSLATSETLSPTVNFPAVSVSETVGISETLTPGAVARSGSLSDTISQTEAYNIVTYLAAIGDAVATSDIQSASAAGAAALADSAATTDLFFSPSLLDQVTTNDLLTGQASGFQSLLDTVLSGDIVLPVRGFVENLTDNAASADALTVLNFGYSFYLNDSPSATEELASVGVGSPLTMTATAIPTGGAVLLEFPGYFPVLPRATHLTISRSVQGSGTWMTIYDGPPVGVFLDVGDGLAKPLDSATAYLWQAEDYSGTTVIGPLTPASTFINMPDQLTQILIRALQGALNSMVLPTGIQKPQITIKMPMNGWQAMPFIVVNVDLIQQTEVEVGEDVINPTEDNNWTLFANAKRVWRVTIMSQDAEERDFYRDTLLAVFRVLKATAFGPIGLDVSHTFQAVSYSSAQEWEGVTPGFYGSDLMLEINGTFPAAVLTNYPTILRIESDPTYTLDTFTETFTLR